MPVKERSTIDFDQHSQEYKNNWVTMASDLHATGQPIAWSPHHGGFWVVASWDEVHRIGSDWESFTSVNDLDGTENGGRGQQLPQQPYRLHLGESDPPLHTDRRRLEVPFFTPKAIRKWRPMVRRHLYEAIDAVIESGRAELIDDIIIPTTARTTLYVLGYGTDDWEDAAAAAHLSSFLQPSDENYPMAEMGRLRVKFRDMLLDRRAEPAGDIISALANGTVQDRPMTLEEGESMMNALVFGGFDTTTASTASMLIYLDKHPELKDRVLADPKFRSNAVEEMLRVVPPPAGMARTAVRDVEIMGQQIRKGDSVFMWLAAANRDPLKFEDPNTIDLERVNAAEHVTFSTGHHRCLGSPLAKAEISEMVESILVCLADFSIDHDAVKRYPNLGGVNGYSQVPATFTPGKPTLLESLEKDEI